MQSGDIMSVIDDSVCVDVISFCVKEKKSDFLLRMPDSLKEGFRDACGNVPMNKAANALIEWFLNQSPGEQARIINAPGVPIEDRMSGDKELSPRNSRISEPVSRSRKYPREVLPHEIRVVGSARDEKVQPKPKRVR